VSCAASDKKAGMRVPEAVYKVDGDALRWRCGQELGEWAGLVEGWVRSRLFNPHAMTSGPWLRPGSESPRPAAPNDGDSFLEPDFTTTRDPTPAFFWKHPRYPFPLRTSHKTTSASPRTVSPLPLPLVAPLTAALRPPTPRPSPSTPSSAPTSATSNGRVSKRHARLWGPFSRAVHPPPPRLSELAAGTRVGCLNGPSQVEWVTFARQERGRGKSLTERPPGARCQVRIIPSEAIVPLLM
jgi:hypothetical protein